MSTIGPPVFAYVAIMDRHAGHDASRLDGDPRGRDSITVLEACEFFVLYKFFAFPMVDTDHHIIGVVDISLFTAEMLGENDPGSLGVAAQADEIFAALGVRLSQRRGASAWRVFRYRFPWLLATIFGGNMCAPLAGAFEALTFYFGIASLIF
jgi:Mg/Co/Ni transporter MgtE